MSPYLKRRLRSLEEIILQRRGGAADLDQRDRIGARLDSPVRAADEDAVIASVSTAARRPDSIG
jgi:hypothetical protein